MTLHDQQNEELLNEFNREEVNDYDGNSWGWSLTRFAHEKKSEECREKLGLDIPPFALYVFHLNAGRDLELEPAIEKGDECWNVRMDYGIISVGDECVSKPEWIRSEPDLTEVGEESKTLFQDQFEEDLPISESDWEFGLHKEGLWDTEWEYTKSGTTLLDKRTFTATVDSKERKEIHDPIHGGNDLDIRCFLTTEEPSGIGNYAAVVGVVPDDDSVDTGITRSDPVEFKPENHRDNMRTLMKAVSA